MDKNKKEDLSDFNFHDEFLGKNPYGRIRKNSTPVNHKNEQQTTLDEEKEPYRDAPFILRGDSL